MSIATLPGWRCLAESVAGTSHLAHQLPCQDAHKILALGDKHLVLAVADGAGSAKHAEQGAKIAVDISTEFVSCHLSELVPQDQASCENILRQAFIHTRTAIEQAHAEIQSSSRQLFL